MTIATISTAPPRPAATEDPVVDGAWGQLLRVMLDLWPAYVAACAAHDLPPQQGQALLRMVDRGTVMMRDLADLLAIDPSTVTGIVDRMESHGLLERLTGTDRRVKLLTLTPHGERVRAELLDSLHRAPGAVARLTPSQQATVADSLAQIGDGPCQTFPR